MDSRNLHSNITAKKGLGQNFLINQGVVRKIVEAGEIDKSYGVIEIGPGKGALTGVLLKEASKVVAIEIDTDLIPELLKAYGDSKRFKLIHDDVLKVDIKSIIEMELEGLNIVIFGNLPYYITSPIIMKLLEDNLQIKSIVAMVQKEAAIRFCAKEGSRESGAVTLAIRYFSEPQILFDVSPGSFYPQPSVTSTVIRLDIRKEPPVVPCSEEMMFKTIRAAFMQRRKTAVNAISAGLYLSKDSMQKIFIDCKINVLARAEQLTLNDYMNISDRILGFNR